MYKILQNKNFSLEFNYFCQSIKDIMKSREDWRYQITNNDAFAKIQDHKKLSQIYWKELLSRVQIASFVSLFKAIRWLDGVESSYDNKIYYSFASNLRGFVESCADSFYTLKTIPLSLARDFEVIKRSAHLRSEVLLTFKPLEDILVHFSHASKQPNSLIDIPKEMHSKQIREYLNSISKTDDKIDRLYSFLCQISHPSYHSNNIFLFPQTQEIIVCSESFKLEEELIKVLLEEFNETIYFLFKCVCITSFECLKLINMLDIIELYTQFDFEDKINDLEIWAEVQGYINHSKILYEDAIKNGVYR